MLLTPAAGNLPGSVRLGGVILCIFLFTVAFNVGYDPYQALMPDITPEAQRGRVNGLAVLFGNLAQAGILMASSRAGRSSRSVFEGNSSWSPC